MIWLNRYPREIRLRDGACLTLRPMEKDDADRLWDFFCRIPEEDKMFFREDVSRKEVVERWAENIDYASVLPVLALAGDQVVADATLHRNRTGWKQRVGTIRIQIAPEFRKRGLGTAMIREMRHLGEKAALRYLVAEAIEEQQAAVRAFEKMGFERKGLYPAYVNDQRGRLHTLLVFHYPMPYSEVEMVF